MNKRSTQRERAHAECMHRYNHCNAVLTDDPEYAGHFFATEDTFWMDPPVGYDPGVLYPKIYTRCVCCFHMEADGSYSRHQEAP